MARLCKNLSKSV